VSQVINQYALPTAVRALYEPVKDHLEATEEVLRQELKNESAFVNELLQYGGQLGGKRLRPALLLLSATATGTVTPDHYVLAAVVEMIHTATLVHDDVLDEADMRRHLATVNSRWNNETSVLLGDYLFTHAFYLASTLESTYACRRIGRSTNIVCEGELRQVGNRGNHALSEEEYFDIINGKTAELCACACHLGAKFAGGNDATIERMERFGRSLGMAFQIADDLLDLLGNETATGKSLGTDLEKQKPTLPLIRLYETVPAERRADLELLLQSTAAEDRRVLSQWLEQSDALNYARSVAARFAAQARAELERLSASAARDILSDITDFVVARSS
jgi:octaprenyl-diphosphate synthase